MEDHYICHHPIQQENSGYIVASLGIEAVFRVTGCIDKERDVHKIKQMRLNFIKSAAHIQYYYGGI